MLDNPASLNPAWTGQLALGAILHARIVVPDGRRVLCPCAVSDIASHHGAIFIELVPALPSTTPPDPGDIEIDPAMFALSAKAEDDALWLRLGYADRLDAAHPGIAYDPARITPVIGQLSGPALAALDAFRDRREADRALRIATRWSRRRRRRG